MIGITLPLFDLFAAAFIDLNGRRCDLSYRTLRLDNLGTHQLHLIPKLLNLQISFD